jgi:hypothetical protein
MMMMMIVLTRSYTSTVRLHGIKSQEVLIVTSDELSKLK